MNPGEHSINSLLELLASGKSVATKMNLARTIKTRESGFGWMMGGSILLAVDPAGLSVHRNGWELHVLRDGEDILRRTKQGAWHFEGDPVPSFHPGGDVASFGLMPYFLGFPLVLRSFSGYNAAAVQETVFIGRPVVIVPLAEFTLTIDTEYGVILKMEDATEMLQATEVTFPDSWSSPTWEGPTQTPPGLSEESAEPAPRPEPPVLPPTPEGPRELRIYCGQDALEGSMPDWTPGENLRLRLSFSLDEPPLAGLLTTRRGLLDPRDDTDHRRYTFRAQGWSALLQPEEPLREEEELRGYFRDAGYADFSEPTDVVVTAVHHYDQDLIIDVTLDGALPPPLEPHRDGSVAADAETLWVAEYRRPVIRGYDRRTGELLHHRYPPTDMPVVLKEGPLAWNFTTAWTLPELEETAEQVLPAVPEGWEFYTTLDTDLHVLRAKERATQALLRTHPALFQEVDLEGWVINDGYQLGEQIIVWSMSNLLVLDKDLNVQEIYAIDTFSSEPSPQEGAPELGRKVGTQVVFSNAESSRLRFVDAQTVVTLTTFTAPETHRAEPVYGTGELILVALWNDSNQIVDRLATWSPANGWQVLALTT
ncbi:hypothetical protein [Corynebacterium sp. A21]|uniref:hypothetical protein n=1 Tax=Corynebacterium sp. A21 TaxID=3457318 RepID=UPI003FD2FADF